MLVRALTSLALVAVLVACGDPRGNFPAGIDFGEQLVSNDEGFFGEGCHVSVYRLSEGAVARLRQAKRGQFGGPQPRDSKAPRFGPWQETPSPSDSQDGPDPLVELGSPTYAIGGCGTNNPYDRQIEEALLRPGSYFSLTENGEGLIVLAPKQGIAAFMYVG